MQFNSCGKPRGEKRTPIPIGKHCAALVLGYAKRAIDIRLQICVRGKQIHIFNAHLFTL